MMFKSNVLEKNSIIRRGFCLFVMFIFFSGHVFAEDDTKLKTKEAAQNSVTAADLDQVQADQTAKKGSSELHDSQVTTKSESKEQANDVSTEDVVSTSQVDVNKAMEQTLQETMIKEIKAYYPIIRGISFESKEDLLVMKIDYDQSSETDLLNIQTNLIKGKMIAAITFKSALLQKKEDVKVEGDHELIEAVTLTPNLGLSSKLGNDEKLFFVNQVQFQLLKPVRWKVTQVPGTLKIEFKPYLAGEEEEEKKQKEDLVFQAPPPQNTQQILGESYTREREYESNVVSGGEPTLIESLEGGERAASQLFGRGIVTDYSKGLSEEAVRVDMKSRYPTFGSLDYWKKNISGVISNTARFMKKQRKQSFFPVDDPGLAVVFDRKGPAHVRLGYNVQRELPFFYGTLHRTKRLAPMDGFMRHDIKGGVVFKSQSPWIYSIQNNYSVGTSENLSQPSKFGDRLSAYQYAAGHGLRYNFKRGYAQLGSGLLWRTEERGINEDVKGYISTLWVRPWTKKITTRLEYDYTRTFLHDPRPILDVNVHKMYFGLDYKPNKNVTLTPNLGWSFYDGESFAGFVGGFKYRHKINSRDSVTINYSTDFIRSQSLNFASESLATTRGTFGPSDALVRYQTISADFNHQLTKRINFNFTASYRRERQFEIKDSDRLDEYRVSAGLSRQISKEWALQLRYSLIYLNAYRISEDTLGNKVKRDAGNTEHSVDLRVLRYFGETGR